MSVDQLLNMIQRVVQQEMLSQRSNLLGVVTEIFTHEAENDENNYEVNVLLKHEDLELRRVPIAVGHIGIAVPPRVGDLVLVQFIHGDLNQPVVTGRFYHADDRPPLHKADDVLFEHRVPGDEQTLNHLRFSSDGSIYIQRDVKKPEDNSEAKAGIKIDKDGNIEIQAGEKIVMTLTNDDNISIKADGKAITIDCDTLTVNGKLVVDNGSNKTTIDGNEITGA
jgi:hypothetical protein